MWKLANYSHTYSAVADFPEEGQAGKAINIALIFFH